MLPWLSRLSVSIGPGSRLRHRCSSRYLRISPLHLEFRFPLPYSSQAVSRARHWLSQWISPPTCLAAYTPFTPSNSEQRLLPPYYRGCWHGVSRSFLWRYRQAPRLFTSGRFVPLDRGLQPKGLHPPRGVARSGFPPLPKPLDCCLPKESGPYLSPSVAGRPLRPATHRSLGGPLPHQLANGTRDHPRAAGPFGSPPLVARRCPPETTFGISHSLERLSPTRGQVSHALLTRSPLRSKSCPSEQRSTCMPNPRRQRSF